LWQLVRRLLALDEAPGIKMLRGIGVGSVGIMMLCVVDAIFYGRYGLIPLNPMLFFCSLASLSRAIASQLEKVQRGRREPQGVGRCLWEYVKLMGRWLGILLIIAFLIGVISWLTSLFGTIVLVGCGAFITIMLTMIFWEKVKGVVLVVVVVALVLAVIGLLVLIWSFSPAVVFLILLIAGLIGVVALLRKK
jgi:hypothetical protein